MSETGVKERNVLGGELRVFFVGSELEPSPGWTVFSLLPAESKESPSGETRKDDSTSAQAT